MLAATARQQEQQRRIVDMATRDARRVASRGPRAVAKIVNAYQAANVATALQAAPDVLAEQGIPTDAVGSVATRTMLTQPSGIVGMLDKVSDQVGFDRLIGSLVQDAGRSAAQVDLVARTHVTGYVRALSGSSCARCAILAGRVYRWSSGFQRHPLCDCVMVPTSQAVGPGLITDPMQAFAQGKVHGLSRADTKAVNSGADLAQVVNIRRKQAGLMYGDSVLTRGGIMTPAGIFRSAETQGEAVALLEKHGYLVERPTLQQVAGGTATATRAETASAGDFHKSLTGANPRHNKDAKVTGSFSADKALGDIGYNYNCANSVTAFEMRFRGQDVSAKPVVDIAAEGRVDKFLERWRTPEGAVPDMTQTKGLRGTQELVKSWGDEGRGFVMVQWKRDGGHVLMARNEGGKVRFFDPQSGEERGDEMFQRVATRMAWTTRSDNLTPAVDFGEFVE